MSTKLDVIRLNQEHPDWTARQIATALGARPEYVHVCGYRYNLTFAKSQRMSGENSITHLGWAAKRAGLTVDDIKRLAGVAS